MLVQHHVLPKPAARLCLRALPAQTQGLLAERGRLWRSSMFCLLSSCQCVCACVCWGWERAVPVDTSNVKRAGALTGAVTGIAGGSLSINPPSAANQIPSPWKHGYCYLHSCQLRPKWVWTWKQPPLTEVRRGMIKLKVP